jgi:hypothetical protein
MWHLNRELPEKDTVQCPECKMELMAMETEVKTGKNIRIDYYRCGKFSQAP